MGRVGAAGAKTYCRCHFWLPAPVHVQICARVPFADVLPVTSRHLLAAVFTTSPVPALYDHCWAAVPLQSYNCTFAPSAVEADVTSRHLPNARTVPSVPTVHCCAVEELQS